MAGIDIDRIKATISIEDVLNFYSIPFKGNRCKCPIHKGDNPTSFSFNDGVFCCHSCGAKGDVFTLVQHLENVGFRESVRKIASLAGITLDFDSIESVGDLRRKPLRPRREPEPMDICIHLGFRETLQEWQADAAQKLRELPNLLRAGKISLGDFYFRRQILDYRLVDIDRGIIALTHKIRIMREEYRNGRNKFKRD